MIEILAPLYSAADSLSPSAPHPVFKVIPTFAAAALNVATWDRGDSTADGIGLALGIASDASRPREPPLCRRG
jgi:hypothetical protein